MIPGYSGFISYKDDALVTQKELYNESKNRFTESSLKSSQLLHHS